MPASACLNFFLKKFKFLPAFFLIWSICAINQPMASAQKANPAPDCKGVTTLEQWYKKTDLWRGKNKTCKPAPGVQAYSHTPIDALDLWKEFWSAHSKASDEAKKKYKYNLVTVKGTIYKTSESFLGYPEISYDLGNTSNKVTCQFPKADQELISRLQPGQYIVTQGTVKSWGITGVIIEDCTLLEVKSD